MELAQWLNFPALGDDRGSLIAIEAEKNIPFAIQRVYYLFGTKAEVARGFHAHKELWQVAICISGKCLMLLDDGRQKESVWMDSPMKGIVLPPMLWHEMHHFSSDCVLLVLASDKYNESDYVRKYEDFLEFVK